MFCFAEHLYCAHATPRTHKILDRAMSITPINGDADLEQTLLGMTVADNATIDTSEKRLKALMRSATCVSMFAAQIQHSGNPAARQLAAILLRKRIPAFWRRQTPETKESFKAMLLKRLTEEPVRAVQTAVAGVVAAVAKITVPAGEWNTLLEFLLALFRDSNVRLRELAMLLFRVLSDSIGESLQVHFSTLIEIFAQGMMDAESLIVREESLRALGALFMCSTSEEEHIVFVNLVPRMLEVIECSCRAYNESAVIYAFEVLTEMSESPVPVLNGHISALVSFCTALICNDDLDLTVREPASNLLIWVIKCQSVRLVSIEGLALHLLQATFVLGTQPCDDEPHGDGMVSATQALALEILDELMIHLPDSLVYTPTLQAVGQLCQSTDPYHRSFGQLILFIMAEGCSEAIRGADLAPLLDVICNGMKDADALVRSNASSALAQFSQHLQPEIIQHHQTVISNLLVLCDNPNESLLVKRRMMTTLDAFCSELTEDIMVGYLQEVLTRVMGFLSNCQDRDTLTACVRAVGGVCTASKLHFLPYASAVMTTLLHMLSCTTDEDMEMRAAATTCIGSIAIALGKDNFVPYLPEVLRLSVEGLKLDFFEIRESTYMLYGNLSQILGEEFGGFLQGAIDMILYSIDSNDGVSFVNKNSSENKDFGNVGEQFNELGEDDEGSDQEEDDGHSHYQISTGFLDEKLSAVQALGEFLKYSGAAMVPHLEKIMASLELASDYPHDSVRICSYLVYVDLFKFSITTWPSPSPGALSNEVNHLVNQIFPIFTLSLSMEFEKQVVSVAVDSLVEIVRALGPACLGVHLQPIIENVVIFLEGVSPAQMYANEEATSTEEELDILTESASDMIGCLAKVMGLQFTPIFAELVKPMLASMQSSSIAGHLCSLIGCFGEVTAELGEGIVQFGDTLFPIFFEFMGHPSAIVRRSASYAVGSMFISGGKHFQKWYTQALAKIELVYQACPTGSTDEQLLAGRDNACSAVAKIMTGNPAGEGLDVSAAISLFVRGLPLQRDLVEGKYAYPCLTDLLARHPDAMAQQFLPQLVHIATEAVCQDEVDEEIRVRLAHTCKSLFTSNSASVEKTMASLPQRNQQILGQILQ